jgi:hypothetical protein
MRSVAEWVLALGVLGGAAWVGTPLVRRWMPPLPSSVTLVESALPALPAGVPAGAESVPFLMLADDAVVRLGMDEGQLEDSRISQWSAGSAAAEEGVIDQRLILPYRSSGTRFWVVLDRTEVGKERQVTAIYVP